MLEEVSWAVEIANAAGWILDVVSIAVAAASKVFDAFKVRSSRATVEPFPKLVFIRRV